MLARCGRPWPGRRRRPGSRRPTPRCSGSRTRSPSGDICQASSRRPSRRAGGAPGPRSPWSQPTPTAPGPYSAHIVVGHDRRVLELEDRRLVAVGREPQLELGRGRVAAHLRVAPRDGQPVRPVAGDDLAAGVALELEPAAEPVVAADRQEPAADPLRVGQRVPDVVDRGVVGPAQPDACGPRRRASRPLPTSRWMASISWAMSIIGCLLRGCGRSSRRSRRSRLPRASSVASESSRWSQNRRKWSSQSSSSWNGAASTA